ncbi:MAG: phosphatase PAP2 family protein [Chloroflexi bacterium]|jgi:undecaprenyl-diphosphatase|nr:phosphatase PAP2 family protein [Chloroflexota bacterium]
MFERIRSLLYRLPLVEHLGIQLLIGLLISLACLGVFAAIADEVREQELLVRIDTEVANELHAQATPSSIQFYRLVSWIGMEGLWITGGGLGLYFLLRRQWLHLAIWIAALIGGTLLNNVLKLIFARARPVFADPFVIERNFSFPSGHAMMSLIGFGLLTYFAWSLLRTSIGRIILVFAALMLILLVGISRMTLGVHYLSDVVAGFAAGGVWLAACLTALNTIQRRKRAGDPAAQEQTGLAEAP